MKGSPAASFSSEKGVSFSSHQKPPWEASALALSSPNQYSCTEGSTSFLRATVIQQERTTPGCLLRGFAGISHPYLSPYTPRYPNAAYQHGKYPVSRLPSEAHDVILTCQLRVPFPTVLSCPHVFPCSLCCTGTVRCQKPDAPQGQFTAAAEMCSKCQCTRVRVQKNQLG